MTTDAGRLSIDRAIAQFSRSSNKSLEGVGPKAEFDRGCVRTSRILYSYATAYMHTYIHTYIHTYKKYIHTYIHITYIHIYVYIYETTITEPTFLFEQFHSVTFKEWNLGIEEWLDLL